LSRHILETYFGVYHSRRRESPSGFNASITALIASPYHFPRKFRVSFNNPLHERFSLYSRVSSIFMPLSVWIVHLKNGCDENFLS